MDFKGKLNEGRDLVKDGPKNFKEWYDSMQPTKRCDMIEGHDNYWEDKIEAIKKVLDGTTWTTQTATDFEKALNDIRAIIKSAEED